MTFSFADILGFFTTISTVAFGIYGLGREPRNRQGQLTTPGKIALTGMIVSLLIALTTQVTSVIAAARDRERAARDSLRVFLSTENARVSFDLAVSLDDLRAVDPTYTARLESALANRASCIDKTSTQILGDVHYVCKDYEVTNDSGLFVTRATFGGSSGLLPSQRTEPFAFALLGNAVAELLVNGRSIKPDSVRIQFPASRYPASATYSFEGDVLHIRIENAATPDLLAQANLPSVVDLLGRQVMVGASNQSVPCPDRSELHASQCNSLKRALSEKIELRQFALRFRHGRDVVFDPIGGSLPFKKQAIPTSPDAGAYAYQYPDSVSDLRVMDHLR